MCHFFLQCSLTNRGRIGVTGVGSGFSRQICNFEFVQKNCLRTVLGYPLCLSCGGLVSDSGGIDVLNLGNGKSEWLLGIWDRQI